MAIVGDDRGVSARGLPRTRCGKCKRFARMLPGDTECAACLGVLALEFSTIGTPVHTSVRGGW